MYIHHSIVAYTYILSYILDLSQRNILRLVGGTTLYDGAVEWKQHSGSGQGWIPFAYDGWSSAHSTVACRALGFTSVAGTHYSLPQRSPPSTCIAALTCSGSEGTFEECTSLHLNSHCTLNLVGIRCSGPLEMFSLATPTPPTTITPSPSGTSLSYLLVYIQ